MKTHSQQSAGIIEALEPRLAPAGVVTLSLSGGVLTITGDADDNYILVTHLPGQQEPGANPQPGVSSWQITGDGGTQFKFNGVTGVGPVNIAAQNGIKADLKDGNDTLFIRDSVSPSGMVLSGGLSVVGGKGNDELGLGNPLGQQLVIGGATTIDMGDGDDEVYGDGSVTFGGAVTIKTGVGADHVELSPAQHVFLKGLSVDLGAGEDTMTVLSNRFDVLGALTIKGAGQAAKSQQVALTPFAGNIEGATTVVFGGGLLELTVGGLGGQTQRFNGGLAVTGANDFDSVFLKGGVTVGGTLSVDGKNGGSLLRLDPGSSLYAGAITMKGGTGVDQFTVGAGSTLISAGALTLGLGDDTNIVTAATGSNVTAASLIFTGGKATDILTLEGANLTILGHATLNLGAGTNIPKLEPTVSGFIGGNLTINGTTGVDSATVTSPSFRVLGNLTMAVGDGTNTLVTGGGLLHVGGNLSFTGGKGDDTLVSSNTTLVVGKVFSMIAGDGASNTVVLQGAGGSIGAVTYKGGAGGDALVLGNSNGTTTTQLTINGGVTAAMGAGAAILRMTDTLLNGPLSVLMAGTAAQTDEVTLNQSTFNGLINITQGAGASMLGVHDSFMRGNFTARLGAGADTLNLDTEAGTASVNTWMGTLYVDMDSGIDAINIGSATNEANARNHFYRLATIDTGAEADIYVPHPNHTFFAGAELRVQET